MWATTPFTLNQLWLGNYWIGLIDELDNGES